MLIDILGIKLQGDAYSIALKTRMQFFRKIIIVVFALLDTIGTKLKESANSFVPMIIMLFLKLLMAASALQTIFGMN